MKRTMKKHLSLIMAVLMLVTSVGLNAVAAGTCMHDLDVNNPIVTNPTCEEEGYTQYKCTLCGALSQPTDYKAPLGHSYGEDQFEAVNGGESYNKYKACTRDFKVNGETVTCGAKSYELENGEKAVYYLVEFMHDKVIDTYDSSIKYTNVAATYKEPVLLQASYVKKGDAAIYEGSPIYTFKTKEYASFQHIGWTTVKDLHATAEDNLDLTDCAIFENGIQANTVLYPVFEGITEKHIVYFKDYNNEPLTKGQEISHGKSATYRIGGIAGNDFYPAPTRPEDVVNTYEFAGWTTNYSGDKVIPMEDIEKEPIYGTVTFYPSYNAVKKLYKVSFYGADKNLIKSFDNITLESNLNTVNDIAVITPTKESDKTYFYTWSGSWQVIKADGSLGTVVDMRNFTVNVSDIIETKDVNGVVLSREIRLVPVFRQTLIRYAVDIEMGVPLGEDMDYYRGEAEVQVVANNGQLVAAGKTDADGKFRCYLNYQVPFTVRIASYEGKYIGTEIVTELFKSDKGDEDEAANHNHVYVTMDKNPEYETHCSCIHHNALIQPIFVRILNLLYTFFNYKYVCCYDMYSTIGPLLEYTAD